MTLTSLILRIRTIFPLSIIEWKSLSYRAFDIYFYINIGQTTLVSIYNYSDSVPWQSQNSREMAAAPKILVITKISFSNILDDVHPCLKEPLIFFWVNICQATQFFVF